MINETDEIYRKSVDTPEKITKTLEWPSLSVIFDKSQKKY
jgi:hypothetical protein